MVLLTSFLGRTGDRAFLPGASVGLWTAGCGLHDALGGFARCSSSACLSRLSDKIRLWSRPVLVLGLTIYLPIGGLVALCAVPERPDDSMGAGYLVNVLAYRAKPPSAGQWVWMRPSPLSGPRAGKVVAVAGQEVEWIKRHWRIDGKELPSLRPMALADLPGGLEVPGA